MEKNTKISIVMPSFNAEKYIKDSINSVIFQTEERWELIIVDDKSTDNTVNIINEILNEDKRINLVINDTRKGAAYSRNRAIELAKGKYIAFLDSDDLWAKDKLTKQLSYMEDNHYKMSYTNYLRFNDGDNPLNGEIYHSPQIITKKQMLRINSIGCLTVMVEADIAKKSLIPTSIVKRNDYALWLKFLDFTDAHNLNTIEAFYRKSNTSLSSGNKFKLIKHHYRVFRLSEENGFITSLFLTIRNIIYYILKRGL